MIVVRCSVAFAICSRRIAASHGMEQPDGAAKNDVTLPAERIYFVSSAPRPKLAPLLPARVWNLSRMPPPKKNTDR